MIPLSTRMRPETLDDFKGQEHFLYKGSLLYNSVERGNFESAIFFGPSGTGKTTLARIIAEKMDPEYKEINATVVGTKELKELIDRARDRMFGLYQRPTYVYIDEIHRWNKLQQDTLLKAIEEGIIKFIGSTTENPYFSINNAILSRTGNIYEFKRLETDDVVVLLKNALENKERGLGNLDVKVDAQVLELIAEMTSGDARMALDVLGFIAGNMELPGEITEELVEEAMQQKACFYNRGDDRYDLLSALQKSIRGSDPDASIHYFARLVHSGASVEMIGRRLLVIASEDISMAYPSAITITEACVSAARMTGFPEAAIILSQAVILLASSPKSNSTYTAYSEALADIKSLDIGEVPDHIRDSHYGGAKKLGRGKGYLYPHAYGGYVKQQYLPNKIKDKKYYEPGTNGSEKKFKKFLENLESTDD